MKIGLVEAVITALAVVTLSLAVNVVSGMIGAKLPVLSWRVVAALTVLVVVAAAVVAVVSDRRSERAGVLSQDRDGGSGAATSRPTPSAPVASLSRTPSPRSTAKSPSPRPATRRPSSPAIRTSSTQASPARTFIDSPSSSKDPHGADRGPVNIRFWTYPSGGDVSRDIRYASGGYTGKYAWAPEPVGTTCTLPYVQYAFGAIPRGRYDVYVYIPDIDNLTVAATFNGVVVDESAHRGEWVHVGHGDSYTGYDGGENFVVQASGRALPADGACTLTATKMAWDAIKIVKA